MAVRYTKVHMSQSKTTNEKPIEAKSVSVHSKRYDDTFKREAVEHWLRSNQCGTQIATALGISYPSLKEWKRRYGGEASPVRAEMEAENRALKAELGRVREQRDILKKTLGILSEPPNSATNGSTP